MKFLFDEMLKKLSNWSRIFGLYSEHYTGKSDSELLEIAKENDLIFVTRDVGLSERCKARGMQCIFINSDKVEEQLAQIIKNTGAKTTFPERMRCASCNGEISPADREKLKEQIPEDVYNEGKEVWQCDECNKIYWQGSHWKNMTGMHEAVMKLLKR
jgi:uncharacterized protein with PIN domain